MMNICVVINSKHYKYLNVMLRSFFSSNSDNISLYCLHSKMDSEYIIRLSEFLKRYNSELIDIEVDETLFLDSPILHNGFSKEGYYKLLIPILIPQDIERILYLDVDTIITSSISELYCTEIDSHLYIAVEDYMVNRKMKEYVSSLGFKKNEKYINTGVLLINLKSLRNVCNVNYYFEYIKENGRNFKFHDQHVINAIYHGRFGYTDEKYNYNPQYRSILDYLKYRFGMEKKPVIIHYSGMKPWFRYYCGKYYYEFWKYAINEIEIDRERRGKRNMIIKYPFIFINDFRYELIKLRKR